MSGMKRLKSEMEGDESKMRENERIEMGMWVWRAVGMSLFSALVWISLASTRKHW